MNTKINAVVRPNVEKETVVFNNTTEGLELGHPKFSLEAFEIKGNGMRLVIDNGLVVFGREDALANAENAAVFVDDLGQKMTFISAATQLMRYGFKGYVPGFHPLPERDSNRLTTKIGYVCDNYAGNDFGVIPAGGWYPVIEKPVAGKQGKVVQVGKKALEQCAQDKHNAIDLLIDGKVIAGYWPKGNTERGEQIVTWLDTVIGHTQAILDNDEQLIAIYKTRYNERVTDRLLNWKAARNLRGLSEEELDVSAKVQVADLIMTTVDGDAIIMSEVGTGSSVRFYNASGRYQGQQTWVPTNAYSVQKFQEAAKMGWTAQVLFDTAAL